AVMNLYFDSPRARVPECVAQRFAGNPIDFIADGRREVPGPAFSTKAKLRRAPVAGQPFAESRDRLGQRVPDHFSRPQSQARLAPLSKRRSGLFDDAVQLLSRFSGPIPDQVLDRGEFQ